MYTVEPWRQPEVDLWTLKQAVSKLSSELKLTLFCANNPNPLFCIDNKHPSTHTWSYYTKKQCTCTPAHPLSPYSHLLHFSAKVVFNHSERRGLVDGGSSLLLGIQLLKGYYTSTEMKLGYIDPSLNGACGTDQQTLITQPSCPRRKGSRRFFGLDNCWYLILEKAFVIS